MGRCLTYKDVDTQLAAARAIGNFALDTFGRNKVQWVWEGAEEIPLEPRTIHLFVARIVVTVIRESTAIEGRAC